MEYEQTVTEAPTTPSEGDPTQPPATTCNSCEIASNVPSGYSQAMTDMFEDILSSLGGNLVDVELCEKDFLVAFKKAKRTFQQKGHNSYRREFLVLDVNKNTTVYNLPENVDTVVKIIKTSTGFFNMEDAFAMAAYNDMFTDVYGSGCGSRRDGFDFLTYEFTLDRINMLQRMAAYETQFHHDIFRHTLTLLKKPDINGKWLVECYTNLSDDEYAKIDWIIRWATAECKHMLGMAYRKFSSLPGPTGDMSLDGASYIQEAAQEKEQLLEDIANFVDGSPDYMEIRFG